MLLPSTGAPWCDDLTGSTGADNALHQACRSGHVSAVRLLLTEGYKVLQRGRNSSSTLQLAAIGSSVVMSSEAVAVAEGAGGSSCSEKKLQRALEVAAAGGGGQQAAPAVAGGSKVAVPRPFAAVHQRPDLAASKAAVAAAGNGSPPPAPLPKRTAGMSAFGVSNGNASKSATAAVAVAGAEQLSSGARISRTSSSSSSNGGGSSGRNRDPLALLRRRQQPQRARLCAGLLIEGADLTAVDGDGITVSMAAAGGGQGALLEACIEAGVGGVGERDRNGWGVLHWAAASGNAGRVLGGGAIS